MADEITDPLTPRRKDTKRKDMLPVEEVVQTVLAGAKYATIAPALVANIAVQELAKGARARDAVKQVKSRLHQSVAAYWDGRANYAAWRAALDAAQDETSLRTALLSIMGAHYSTRERLPFLTEFYRTVFDRLAPIRSVLDLGCGLNPLALPWMNLPAETVYYACDVDREQMAFLAGWLEKVDRRGQAFVWNLLDGAPQVEGLLQQGDVDAERPAEPIDVALLLKIVPCLEQLDKRIGARLLEEVTAQALIVSFPAQSLGGRRKGMVEHYTAHMNALLDGRGYTVERFEFAGELVFRLRKGDR